MRPSRSWLTIATLLAASPAAAQVGTGGFAVDRFDPSERGSDWFTAESLDLRGSGRFAAGAVFDWAHRPLVVYENGEAVDALIANQLLVHPGLSVVLWERMRLAVNLPIALYQNGSAAVVGGRVLGSENKTALGDLRLGTDVRLLGNYRGPLELAGGAQLYVPTGDRGSFTSDGSVRFAMRGLVAGEVGRFVYGGKLSFEFRPEGSGYAGNVLGNQVYGAAAAGLRFGAVVVGPEVFSSTVVSQGAAAFDKTTTPVELLLGGHGQLGDVKLGAGVGKGLTHGLGAPAYRVLASVEWAPVPNEALPPAPPPPAPPPDRDHDAIVDARDACPDEAGPASEDPSKNGCPPRDRDRDGILDEADACPDQPGKPNPDPKLNGCPDSDGDGIVDGADACPGEPGEPNDDPTKNGCPAPKDTDGDGVLDLEDACPKDPGPRSADPKTNGCPLAHVEADEIKIMEPVKFANNSDVILPEGEVVLDAVRSVLVAHPEIATIEVRGHTDSRGSDASNLRLSKRRAAAVKKWLDAHGIEKTRVSSEGFGETLPIDTNDTDEGRRNNRRVEFRILTTR
jgi:OmpA-OmpF porin, OOP family